ncbi:hypothetical protein AOLI_G00282810 [Acnodon oligacanthus]
MGKGDFGEVIHLPSGCTCAADTCSDSLPHHFIFLRYRLGEPRMFCLCHSRIQAMSSAHPYSPQSMLQFTFCCDIISGKNKRGLLRSTNSFC